LAVVQRDWQRAIVLRLPEIVPKARSLNWQTIEYLKFETAMNSEDDGPLKSFLWDNTSGDHHDQMRMSDRCEIWKKAKKKG